MTTHISPVISLSLEQSNILIFLILKLDLAPFSTFVGGLWLWQL
jgi:hypothetical protein